MEKLVKVNKDFDVTNVSKRSFGKGDITKDDVNNIGLNFGLLKAIQCDSCANYLGTAEQNYNELSGTG